MAHAGHLMHVHAVRCMPTRRHRGTPARACHGRVPTTPRPLHPFSVLHAGTSVVSGWTRSSCEGRYAPGPAHRETWEGSGRSPESQPVPPAALLAPPRAVRFSFCRRGAREIPTQAKSTRGDNARSRLNLIALHSFEHLTSISISCELCRCPLFTSHQSWMSTRNSASAEQKSRRSADHRGPDHAWPHGGVGAVDRRIRAGGIYPQR